MPQETGPYHLRRCLGVGGQGQVWRAVGPDGIVALKLARTPQERQHLQAEGALLSQLQHPYIVRHLRHDPRGYWLATALVSGQPLDRWAKGRPMRARMAMLAALVEGLAYLHERGIRHGDLKPDNVLVDDTDTPCLIDLSPSTSGGSLGYAAPEQLLGEPVGLATDVYALGCLAYQLLTDQPPFSATDRNALMWMPVNTLPLPPSSLTPGIPQRLEAAVMDCLTRTPAQRPTDLHALALTLQDGLDSPTARPVLGMLGVRRLLRRRLIEALEGHCPMITVLGAPRSGRGTLIEEVLQAAAREGMTVLRPTPQAAAAAVLGPLSARPFALRLEASAPHTAALCAAILSSQPAGITLVRSEVPLAALPREGWVRPTKLDESDIAGMLASANQSPSFASDVHRITGGHPGVVRDYILQRGLPSDLSPQQRVLLSAVTTGSRTLYVLAMRLGLGEHELLDLAEPLLERGLLEERDGGRALVAVLPRPSRR